MIMQGIHPIPHAITYAECESETAQAEFDPILAHRENALRNGLHE
jgi:hypothetical protein